MAVQPLVPDYSIDEPTTAAMLHHKHAANQHLKRVAHNPLVASKLLVVAAPVVVAARVVVAAVTVVDYSPAVVPAATVAECSLAAEIAATAAALAVVPAVATSQPFQTPKKAVKRRHLCGTAFFFARSSRSLGYPTYLPIGWG